MPLSFAGPRLAKRVLLIGWDAADWKIIHPLLDAGLMPTLERFINEGVIGNLATLQPILSPMLWNSIATGKRPHKHGVHGFVEVKPDGTGIRPVMSTSRKVKAIWNMLTHAEMKSQVFSWFASHPAEPIDGVCVSNLFPQMPPELDGAWPLSPEAIYPQRLHHALSKLRVHPMEIEGCHLQPFIPRAGEIDQSDGVGAKALKRMALALAECATVHAAATWTMEHEPWDFCAIYYNAIDRVCHDFMTFHPPAQNPAGNDKWADLFRDVVNGIYRFHDMMLERLLQLAGPDTTVMIISDHGFHSDHLRPHETPDTPLGPAVWHRAHGVFAMRGPGIQVDERIYGASILDITPTVLTLLGLPIGEDMDGKLLADAFIEPPAVHRIPSWEHLSGAAGMHPLGFAPQHSAAADEALQQLVDLGYVAALSDEEKTTIKMARSESTFNLAVSLLDAGLPNESIPLLESLYQECRDDRFALMLAEACLAAGRLDEARSRLEELLERRSLPNEYEDGASSYSRLPKADLLLGTIKFEQGMVDEALIHLKRAEATNATMPTLHSQLGYVYLQRRLWPDAERAFNTALAIDGDNARACHGMAVALLRQDRAADAAEWALRAIGLQHFFPAAHFQLGFILARLNWPERAVQAFEAGLKMRPNAVAAHRYVSRLYARLGQDEKARAHRRLTSVGERKSANAPAPGYAVSQFSGSGIRPEFSETASPH
ncbi:MAG: alkaline phosphatase family protein [Chthoniobacterales bacterium]